MEAVAVQADEWCDHCGAKIKKHKFTVNRSVAQQLIKLRRLEVLLGKREIWLNHDDVHTEFAFTLNELRNFTRLRFLGLARYTERGSAHWFLTRRGYQFLRGEPVPRYVWTFRNKIVDSMRTDETITLAEAYRKDSVPFYEPITDQMIANASDLQEAVARVETVFSKPEPTKPVPAASLRTYSVTCTRKVCENTVQVEAGFGHKPSTPFCSTECRELHRKRK